MKILKNIKEKAKKLKRELVLLHLAYGHSQTPWTAKAIIVLVIGYALSPIDLIPDFIPVLGLLDDIILLPLGIYWAIKLIPNEVIEECRERARTYSWDKKKSIVAGVIIALIWILAVYLIVNNIFIN
ncbi:YkvA family protein [Confluentibacter sediminis]|uniref:YkvA family protein n=1 Tax=Confluentibacter sediminis TaxID=2219045 RepID=UPI000DABB1D6|nr:DUF1232 domain-containing protein [Confluentibacter sediminis]